MLINFYDQEFIIRAIKIGNSDYHELISKYTDNTFLNLFFYLSPKRILKI